MSGRRAHPSRWARVAARVAVAVALVALSLFIAPGPASAAGTVTPLLDCVVQNSNGSYTAVLGYSNTTGRTTSIPFGTYNVITPSKYDRVQPTTFHSGTYHGVFKVTVSAYDIWSSPEWRLNGDTIDYADVTANSCPPPTSLPAVGNGTGLAIGVVIAGVVGVLFLRRTLRRAQLSSPGGSPDA
jgi:hypothetical protein